MKRRGSLVLQVDLSRLESAYVLNRVPNVLRLILPALWLG
jgi:hypothetical protein